MSEHFEGLEQRLSELRAAFDESFAAPAAQRDVDYEDMLAIDVGGRAYAARVTELSGVHAFRKVAPLPNRAPGQLGVVGIRGRLVAAYRLSDILGAEARSSSPRWLLVAHGSQVGLAIEGLTSYVRVAPSSLYPARDDQTLGKHIREVLVHDGVTMSVLNIPTLVASIIRAAAPASQAKES